jgi:transposase
LRAVRRGCDRDQAQLVGVEHGGRSRCTGGRSSRRKMNAVLHLLRGEDLDTLPRKLGVTAATLSHWRDQFLATGRAGLQSRPADERDEELRRLRAKIVV